MEQNKNITVVEKKSVFVKIKELPGKIKDHLENVSVWDALKTTLKVGGVAAAVVAGVVVISKSGALRQNKNTGDTALPDHSMENLEAPGIPEIVEPEVMEVEIPVPDVELNTEFV